MKRMGVCFLCVLALLVLLIGTASAEERRDLVTEDQIYPQADGFTTNQAGPKPFVYDLDEDGTPETYYLGAGLWNMNNNTERVDCGATIGMGGPSPQTFTLCVSFWTQDDEGNFWEVTPQNRAALTEAFGETLTFTLYALRTDQSYPLETSDGPTTSYPLTMTKQYDFSANGDWLYVAKGTVGEQTVEAAVYFNVGFWAEEREYRAASLEEAQEIIDGLQWEYGVNHLVFLPEGELEGDLVIPETCPGFDLYGVFRDGARQTTLKGSIVANNDMIHIWALNLQGDGTNSAVSGPALAYFGNCVVENYANAVATDGFSFGSFGTVFRNNSVAITVNTDDGGGNGQLQNCTFERNGVALNFQRFPGDKALGFRVEQCKFIDNGADVCNALRRSIFLPFNYFERGGSPSGVVAVGSVVTRSTGDADVWKVYDYPVATDATCQTFNYEDASPTVSNALRYQIPVSQLSGSTITVLDNETELVSLTFTEPQTALASVSLMSDDAVFDPRVTVGYQDDGSLLVDLQPFPEDLALEITVPCRASWTDVWINETQETVNEDHTLTFRAATGRYRYTVKPVDGTQKEAAMRVLSESGGMVCLEAENYTQEALEIVVASYDGNGKLLNTAILPLPEQSVRTDVSLLAEETAYVKLFCVTGKKVPKAAAEQFRLK